MVVPDQVKPPARFIPLKQIIQNCLQDTYDESGVLYEMFEKWAWRGWKLMRQDVVREVRRVYLPVASSTKTVKLPKDFIDHTYLGVLPTGAKHFTPLSINNTILVTDVNKDALKQTCKCECGCGSELCGSMYNISTVTESVELGTKTTKTRVCSDGQVIEEVTQPVTVFTQTEVNDYSISYTHVQVPFDVTFTSYYKNGSQVIVNVVVDNQTQLDALFLTFGFTLQSTVGSTSTYIKLASPDDYTTLYYSEQAIKKSIPFSNSNKVITNHSTVENQTTTTNVCEVAVNSCGCIVDTAENLDVLCSCCALFNAYWTCELGKEPTPSNCYGEYTFLYEDGYIQLNQDFHYNQVYLVYYSDGMSINGIYYVSSFVEEALTAYGIWKSIAHKRNVPQIEKSNAKEEWRSERRDANRRLKRPTLDEVYDAVRTLSEV